MTAIGNYFSMMFIPIGVILYLVIRYSTDYNISKRGLYISSGEYTNSCTYPNIIEIADTINSKNKINNKVFILKGLPVKLDELQYYDLRGINYLKMLIEFNFPEIMCKNNILCKKEMNFSRRFAARIAYDEFITSGFFAANASDSMDRFLHKNGIVVYNDLRLEAISCSKISMHIMNFGEMQCRSLSRKHNLFASGNGLLLFLKLNNFIMVTNC